MTFAQSNSLKPKAVALLLLWIAIFVVWAVSGWLLYDKQDRGTFGDMFGAVNALFSGLAFATLIYTTWMQKEELALQRQELADTRMELRGQREQLQAQNETLKLQRFEDTFFAMLRTHGEIVNAMRARDGNSKTVESRACFYEWYQKLSEVYVLQSTSDSGKAEDRLENAYRVFYQQLQADLGHYFRHLYRIVKFVDESAAEEKKYTGLIRAQLSAYEQLILFYNCLSTFGREKFKPLVECYALLENMPQGHLISSKLHLPLYAVAAYGSDNNVVNPSSL
jgi:hypothetical protein